MATANLKGNVPHSDGNMKSKLSNTSFSNTKDKILTFLLVNRSISSKFFTVKEIAHNLNLSVNIVRQNLVIMEKENLVIETTIKKQTGRPAMGYSIHENAFDLFPKRYKDFSLTLISQFKNRYGEAELVDLLRKVGLKLAKQIMDQNRRKRRRNESTYPLKQVLKNQISLLGKLDYFIELREEKDSFFIKNYNCPLYGIVKAEPLVCLVCEALMGKILGKKMRKIETVRGDHPPCIFQIENGNSN